VELTVISDNPVVPNRTYNLAGDAEIIIPIRRSAYPSLLISLKLSELPRVAPLLVSPVIIIPGIEYGRL
jgi:hypothetical protein